MVQPLARSGERDQLIKIRIPGIGMIKEVGGVTARLAYGVGHDRVDDRRGLVDIRSVLAHGCDPQCIEDLNDHALQPELEPS